jgi:predicted RNase H-like HicB family nuclease
MDLRFTAIFEEGPEGYIAYVAELPGANAQGATLVEARANLEEAVELVMDANRTLSAERLGSGRVIRESLERQP